MEIYQVTFTEGHLAGFIVCATFPYAQSHLYKCVCRVLSMQPYGMIVCTCGICQQDALGQRNSLFPSVTWVSFAVQKDMVLHRYIMFEVALCGIFLCSEVSDATELVKQGLL